MPHIASGYTEVQILLVDRSVVGSFFFKKKQKKKNKQQQQQRNRFKQNSIVAVENAALGRGEERLHSCAGDRAETNEARKDISQELNVAHVGNL